MHADDYVVDPLRNLQVREHAKTLRRYLGWADAEWVDPLSLEAWNEIQTVRGKTVLRLPLFKIPCRYLLVFGAVAIALWCMGVRSTPPEIFNGQAWLSGTRGDMGLLLADASVLASIAVEPRPQTGRTHVPTFSKAATGSRKDR